ncbi:hypothetical protein pb186bvf_007514 [Paramecium bursaria]
MRILYDLMINIFTKLIYQSKLYITEYMKNKLRVKILLYKLVDIIEQINLLLQIEAILVVG